DGADEHDLVTELPRLDGEIEGRAAQMALVADQVPEDFTDREKLHGDSMANPMSATNAYLMRSTVVAALGGLLFGFDTAVIAGATHALTTVYTLTPTMLGVTVSSALAGTVIGSALAGAPAD